MLVSDIFLDFVASIETSLSDNAISNSNKGDILEKIWLTFDSTLIDKECIEKILC